MNKSQIYFKYISVF